MDGRTISAFIGFAVLFLLVALLFPTAMTASQTNASSEYFLTTGDKVRVTDGLNVTANNVNSTAANITVLGTQTGDSDTQVINETNTSTFLTDGTNTNITVNEITSKGQPPEDTANLTVEYSRTYHWEENTRKIIKTADVLLALLGFLVVFGGLWVIMP